MQDQHPAVPFLQILAAELAEIEFARTKRGVDQNVPRDGDSISRAQSAGLLGLAFSGGGIRSATFNLGVLQAFAGAKLLTQIDYLSTVSGGGYIGSWFISLMKKNGTDEQVQTVQETLSPEHACHPGAEDQQPIEFLRQYSNYLTPRLTFYSADVWTTAATWIRNTLLNLLLLISSISAVLILPRLVAVFLGVTHGLAATEFDLEDGIPTVLLFALTTVMLCLRLRRIWQFGQGAVQLGILVPLFIGTAFLARWLRFDPEFFGQSSFWTSLRIPWIFFTAAFACIITAAGFFPCFRHGQPNGAYGVAGLFQLLWTRVGAIAVIVFASVVPGFLVALFLWGVAAFADESHGDPQLPWSLLAWGPPVLTLLLAVGMIILVGLLGRDLEAGEREWLSRLRAWTLIYSVTWMIIFGGSIYGPLWIIQLIGWHPWTAMGLSFGWVGSTIAGVLSGKSSATSGKPGAPGTGTGGGNPILDWIARIAPFVFMIGFLLAIVFVIHLLMTSGLTNAQQLGPWLEMKTHYFELLSRASGSIFRLNSERPFFSSGGNIFAVLVAVTILLSFRLDINVFSLHEFYRNRLVRCYLGAVRVRERNPDSFTGFDSNDDQKLTNFNARDGGNYYGPYPIINTTMNVSIGEQLAWQERKSMPFIITPLYCGYDVEQGNQAMRAGESPVPEERRRRGAAPYGYRATEAFCYPHGVNLGTAIAVSGAATSPNQGYHTATQVAFLMTVFDVRLGWWVGNPRRRSTYSRSSPRFNLSTLSEELFGLSSARSGYVNLSDGGHFDNMGLYELVRRRCRYIIVSDAEEDADLTFSSLTRAIRNCRTDFGVEIKIALDQIERKDGYSNAHCVVGTIEYPEGSSNPAAANGPGFLLYMKASLTGDEPADVLGYHTAHPEFPQQTTVDQWFTDSQFESYRKLGQHIAEAAIGSVRSPASDRAAFFHELQSLWYPPSERVEKFSGKHAARFTDLTLALGSEDQFEFLDPQVFTNWGERIGGRTWQRRAVYRVDAFIEFMETLYLDLNLESKHERENPHNQGWLRIFEHWVEQPVFEDTWRRTHDMYGERFQQFYEDLVKRAREHQVDSQL